MLLVNGYRRENDVPDEQDEQDEQGETGQKRLGSGGAPISGRRFSEGDLGDGYYDEVASRRQNFVSRIVNHWVDRLSGAVSDRSFTEQEAEYASGRTKQDYLCNTIGATVWGVVFPLLTIVVTQLVGAQQAGVFSLAFVTGTLLMIIGNYGVRTFQVSDTAEEHSFADYQLQRVITCIVMLAVGYGYCTIRGYTADMFTVSMGVYVYRMSDALADVYEGRLQQADKMYLAGISQAFRSVVVLGVFSAVLFVSRSLPAAGIAMGISAVAALLVVTVPLAYMETPKSRRVELSSVGAIFRLCAPLFVALFMYSLIDNMPKFLMEGTLAYENQLYFNVLYFPAQGILMVGQMVYKPLLLRLSNAWDDPSQKKTFNGILAAVFGAILLTTAVTLFVMGWIGIPIMNFFYGLDFEQFRTLMYLMIVAGGVTACIDFLYQVITVQRRQNSVMKLYLITFVFSVALTLVLIHTLGLEGAVIAYLSEMVFLLVLIIVQLVNIRVNLRRRHRPEAEGVGQMWE